MSVNSIAIRPLGGLSRAAFTPSPTSVRPMTRFHCPHYPGVRSQDTPSPSVLRSTAPPRQPYSQHRRPHRTPCCDEGKSSHPAKTHLLLATSGYVAIAAGRRGPPLREGGSSTSRRIRWTSAPIWGHDALEPRRWRIAVSHRLQVTIVDGWPGTALLGLTRAGRTTTTRLAGSTATSGLSDREFAESLRIRAPSGTQPWYSTG